MNMLTQLMWLTCKWDFFNVINKVGVVTGKFELAVSVSFFVVGS